MAVSQRSRRRDYVPAVQDELEGRVVLSNLGHLPSVVVSGLTPRLRAVGKTRHQPVSALVNKAFDSFVQDFTQARATYLSGGKTADPALTSAFQSYTRSRVNLLGQELISSGLQSTAKASKQQKGNGLSLPLVISKRINGSNPAGTRFLPGTLGQALTDATPQLGQSPAAIALASLAQDQAIEAARVNVLNAVSVIKNGNGGGSSKH